MSRLCGIAALLVSLTLAGCSTPTQPLPSLASIAKQGVPRATGSLGGTESDRSQASQVSGALRHDDFVITVHGVRLGPDMFVQATYDLNPESPWPAGWAGGMDFLTSLDGRLWEILQDTIFEDTGAVAMLKDNGSGFSYSVPLSAMHEPAGPITFAIIVASYDGSYYFRAFGRAECRQCARVAARP